MLTPTAHDPNRTNELLRRAAQPHTFGAKLAHDLEQELAVKRAEAEPTKKLK